MSHRSSAAVLFLLACWSMLAPGSAHAQTVTWVTPPPPIVRGGDQFTVEWEVSGFTQPLTENAVAWGLTGVLGQTPNQAGGNGTYSAVVDVPAVSGSGALFYAAFAAGATEAANASATEVFISDGSGGLGALLDLVLQQQARIAQLEANSVLALDGALVLDTHNGLPVARFTGVNVQVVNGVDQTTINGLGNLIVGYDEPNVGDLDQPIDDKSGSHNLVGGNENSYASFGGLVFGNSNAATGPYSSVSGGYANVASGSQASVAGGEVNLASGNGASAMGGRQNTASGSSSVVLGGGSNTPFGGNLASGAGAVVVGGRSSEATDLLASVFGGTSNRSTAAGATTVGGWFNQADGPNSTACGGNSNLALGAESVVSGGDTNVASGTRSTVSGGADRTAAGQHDWVAGGLFQDN